MSGCSVPLRIFLHPTNLHLTANDVYRKNAWMAVYEMKPASAAEVEGTKGRAAALRTIRRGLKRGLKHLGECLVSFVFYSDVFVMNAWPVLCGGHCSADDHSERPEEKLEAPG